LGEAVIPASTRATTWHAPKVHIFRTAAVRTQRIDFIAGLQPRCARCSTRVYFAACGSFTPLTLHARKCLIPNEIHQIDRCWHGRCVDFGKTNDRRKKMTARHTTLRTSTTRHAPLMNMALLLVSPFIGLAYAVLFPFAGFVILAWVATEGFRRPAGEGRKPAAPRPVSEAAILRVA
jgi:hypothetical protein